mgnify:CR=1 FL=1
MNSTELTSEISKTFCFQPTAEQLRAMETFSDFMFRRSSSTAMILRGSAGTGKTSLAAAIVKTLLRLGQRVVLLAPTGRAAKVFSLNSGQPARTIHRCIYRQKAFAGVDTAFNLNLNTCKNTLFIVDEASMIANGVYSGGDGLFGSGRLLDDLMRFVYSGDNCHLMLIGDKAQLPPVGESESPALEARVIEGYGIEVFECDMNEVLRQCSGSGILFNATIIRQMITHDEMTQLPKIHFDGFADIHLVDGNELVEQLSTSYSRVGIDETMVITRSNRRANIFNQGIRNMILDRDEELCSGDRLMIVKNNYHWTERDILAEREAKKMFADQPPSPSETTDAEADIAIPSFLANGDIAVVQRVRNVREFYGFRFADVWLRFPDYDGYETQLTVLMDSLQSESPSLTQEQQESLFRGVFDDYFDKPTKAEKIKAVREDDYYNALQVKYAYAVTCHKAQGGQWEHIYLDQGYMTDEMLNPDYIHWLYTAFTRATKELYLVNWPKTQRM